MNSPLLAGTFFSALYGLVVVLQQWLVRGEISPIHLNFLTYSIASVGLIFILGVFDRKAFKIKPGKGLFLGILSALVVSVVADLFVLFGLKYSSSINWGFLSRLSIVVTFALAVTFLKEKSSKLKLLAIAISIFGAILIVANPGTSFKVNFGDLMFVGAVLAFAVGNIIVQMALKHITSSQLILIRIVTTSIVLAIITFVFNPITKITSWWFIILNSIILIASLFLINYVIKKEGAAFFTMVASLIPLFIVIFSAIFLREYPTLNQILGGGLVIWSIALFQKDTRK